MDNIQNLRAGEKFVGCGVSKTKTCDTDVILSPSFPQSLLLLILWPYCHVEKSFVVNPNHRTIPVTLPAVEVLIMF